VVSDFAEIKSPRIFFFTMSAKKNMNNNQKIVPKRDLSDDTEAMIEDIDDISQPDIKRIRVETSANTSSDLYLDTVR
jgi:hypothetical protein